MFLKKTREEETKMTRNDEGKEFTAAEIVTGPLLGAPAGSSVGGSDSCDGKPLQKVLKSNKNLGLVLLLLMALGVMVLAVRCETMAYDAVRAPEEPLQEETDSEDVCLSRAFFSLLSLLFSVIRAVGPRRVLYAGLFLVLAWCCCPCCKLE